MLDGGGEGVGVLLSEKSLLILIVVSCLMYLGMMKLCGI